MKAKRATARSTCGAGAMAAALAVQAARLRWLDAARCGRLRWCPASAVRPGSACPSGVAHTPWRWLPRLLCPGSGCKTVVAESGVGHAIHFGSDALRPRKAHRTTPTRTELRTQTKPIPTRSTTSIRTKKHPHAAPCVTSRRCPRAFTLGHAHACELAPLPPCRWPQPARPQQPRTACPLQPT